MPLAEMSADAGAGDRQIQLTRGSLALWSLVDPSQTTQVGKKTEPQTAGSKACQTLRVWTKRAAPPASTVTASSTLLPHTRRAWGQVSRAMLWKKQATPANSFCPFSSFYISFSTISSFTASPLPPSPPPAPRHPVKHVKPRQKETVCVCIASHDIFLYKVLVKL